jgi:hypothetical protein
MALLTASPQATNHQPPGPAYAYLQCLVPGCAVRRGWAAPCWVVVRLGQCGYRYQHLLSTTRTQGLRPVLLGLLLPALLLLRC